MNKQFAKFSSFLGIAYREAALGHLRLVLVTRNKCVLKSEGTALVLAVLNYAVRRCG